MPVFNLHLKFLFTVFFDFKENELKEKIFKSAGSAQYNMKRITFLIYFYIAPGNFSLNTKKSCRKRNFLVRSPLRNFPLKIRIFYL